MAEAHPFGGICKRGKGVPQTGDAAHSGTSYLAAMALRPHAFAWNGASDGARRPLGDIDERSFERIWRNRAP